MKYRSILTIIAATGWLATANLSLAQSTTTESESEADTSKAVAELNDEQVAELAVTLLNKQIGQPKSSRIPLVIRHEAQCIAVFPQITKLGFIIAGKSGRGVVSCRQPETGAWGVPVYYRLNAASLGLQAGVQTSSLMLLVVDEPGVKKLLAEEIALGTEVAIAAGPVGAEAGAQVSASILAYSKIQGIFAGFDVGGTTIKFDKAANAKVYGAEHDAKALLFREAASMGARKSLRDTLNRFAPYTE